MFLNASLKNFHPYPDHHRRDPWHASCKAAGMRFARRPATSQPKGSACTGAVRVGWVPSLEAAALITAHEFGLFEKHNLRIQLSREIGWATTRDRLLDGEVDAAIGPASTLVSLYCGFDLVRRDCLTALLLSSGGGTLALSGRLRESGVTCAASLRRALSSGAITHPPTLATPPALSADDGRLRAWLRAGGVDPDHEVRLVPMHGALALDAFRRGLVDGFCGSRPWTASAEAEVPDTLLCRLDENETSPADQALIVLPEFDEQHHQLHLRLVAALIEAGDLCDATGNHPAIAQLLAKPEYFDLPATSIQRALGDSTGHSVPGARVSPPSRVNGRYVLDLVRARGDVTAGRALPRALLTRVFRQDLHERALALLQPSACEARPVSSPTLAAIGPGGSLPSPWTRPVHEANPTALAAVGTTG